MLIEDIQCPNCGKWIELRDWYESYWHDGDINEENCPYCDTYFKVIVSFSRPDFKVVKDTK
ncbi:hypothetical protein ACNSOL_12165 (plasmid) [Aliarcobacter lanthieri]|uniref:hypothetical protein n=1 Tax=Aliarcobacter lanthieri TaxID=1355374 RepID=UPI003AAFAA43